MQQKQLDNAQPKRLLYEEGNWTLVLETFIALSRDVFMPMTYDVEGEDSIAVCLGRMPRHRALAAGAQQLFAQLREHGKARVAFEAVRGQWSPVAPDPVSARPRESAELIRGLDELNQYKRRVHALERALARMGEMERRVYMLERRIARLEEAERSGVRVAAAPAAEAPAAAAPSAAAPESAPAAAAAPPEEPPKVEEPEEPAGPVPVLRLPNRRGVQDTLQMLLGVDDLVLDEDEYPPQLRELVGVGWYYSQLLNDEGVEVGAVLADIRATVYQGGTLMMMPENVLKDHVRTNSPSEDEVEAMSEVFNNLCSLINKATKTLHVRASAAQPLDDLSAHAWMHEAPLRLDLKDHWDGRLVLLSDKIPTDDEPVAPAESAPSAAEPAAPAAPVADASPADASPADASLADAPTPVAAESAPAATDQPEAASGAEEAPAAEEEAPEEPKGPILSFPSGHDIEDTLQMLLGDDDLRVETEDIEELDLEAEGNYVSRLLNDEDETVGLLVADLRATVFLGGALMMMPDAVLKEHVRSRSPSEDEIEAMSEIFNNVCSLINRRSVTVHVRASAAEPLDLSAFDWSTTPAARMDANDNKGGAMCIMSR